VTDATIELLVAIDLNAHGKLTDPEKLQVTGEW